MGFLAGIIWKIFNQVLFNINFHHQLGMASYNAALDIKPLYFA
jgi:hypothetical protein